MEVDFAEDAGIFAGGDDDGGVVGLFEELGGFVSACDGEIRGFRDGSDFAGDVLGGFLCGWSFEMDDVGVIFLSSHRNGPF